MQALPVSSSSEIPRFAFALPEQNQKPIDLNVCKRLDYHVLFSKTAHSQREKQLACYFFRKSNANGSQEDGALYSQQQ
jgi:hypothetical protein